MDTLIVNVETTEEEHRRVCLKFGQHNHRGSCNLSNGDVFRCMHGKIVEHKIYADYTFHMFGELTPIFNRKKYRKAVALLAEASAANQV